jgi:hypothetical protein
MSKTNDTSYDVAATSERELTIDELDTVSGGLEFTITKFMDAASPMGGEVGGGGAGPAIPAWNKLLGNYGF